ncbi:hypothetical protein [Solitalea koreensis]|uniref:Uncharacterized protein n=1 Tax=Solitalea koreensis TaxID=543615 RepID=A0A521EHX3_9SPHI|nr:hypothetical protein [Solitalea koreensis]SMO83513.1 hypothetical protein SAMN06265350_1159 [Solitalea koreensis]
MLLLKKKWDNVTRVREISKEQDKGWLTNLSNFPRPVKAELNFEGVGAYREAVWPLETWWPFYPGRRPLFYKNY